MTYPAFATDPHATSTFDQLCNVRAGDTFFLRGYEYRASAEAVSYIRNGFANVEISAERRHAAMPSGWELADVREHRKS